MEKAEASDLSLLTVPHRQRVNATVDQLSQGGRLRCGQRSRPCSGYVLYSPVRDAIGEW